MTDTQKARRWTHDELRDFLRTLCRTVWDRQVPEGKHLWSIPADPQRDFDFALGWAFDELARLERLEARVKAERDRFMARMPHEGSKRTRDEQVAYLNWLLTDPPEEAR